MCLLIFLKKFLSNLVQRIDFLTSPPNEIIKYMKIYFYVLTISINNNDRHNRFREKGILIRH